MEKTLLIGLGNPLMGDDGLGPAVIEVLRMRQIPQIEVIDGGVAGLGLIPMMENAHRVFFIDAVRMGSRPGTIRVFRPAEVRSLKPAKAFSLHGMDVLSVLEMAKVLGIEPEITIVGIEPFSVAPRNALSAGMNKLLDQVVEATLEALGPQAASVV